MTKNPIRDHSKWIVLLALLSLISAGLARAQDDKEQNVQGLITSRQGDILKVKSSAGGDVMIKITPSTIVKEPEGKLHMRHKNMAVTALVPGLSIKAKGSKDAQGEVVADQITFSAKDLKTANEIQAGLTPTETQVKENTQEANANQQQIAQTNKRFSELDDYTVKDKADVHFAVGSDALSEQDKAALMQVAQSVAGQQNYLISVKGFADSSGNAVQNEKLSMDRADSVLEYLEQNGKIPIIHIVAPGAMGTSEPVASNETAQGRADNRRVEVKVLVNKGLAAAE